MAVPKIYLLSQEEKEHIHDQSLDILQQVGVHFGSEKALKILEAGGCDVDWDEGSAKIPPRVVEGALETLPWQCLLAARDPAQDIICGGDKLYYTSAGVGLWYRDLETRERRPATSADLVQCTRLIDGLDEIQEYTPTVLPQDVPPSICELRMLQTTLMHTTKHFLGGTSDPRLLPYVAEMIEAVVGDLSRLTERPLFSVIAEPLSPLHNNPTQLDLTLFWSPYKVPIGLGFMPLAGGTSPVTLAGTVLLTNAEFLGNVVLYQLAQPGWPIMWTATAATLDMRTGRVVVGPEAALMSLALIEMAQYYGVPSESMDICAVEAKDIGFQCGMETVFTGLVTALAGVNKLWGPADLDNYTTVDLAHVLLSTEAVRQINRLRQGMVLDDEHFLFDVIADMGFKGEYLGDPFHIKGSADRLRSTAAPSTKKYFCREHLLPNLFPRESYESWQARGQTEEEMAIERVKEILRTHEPEPLPAGVVKELDRIAAAAEKALLA